MESEISESFGKEAPAQYESEQHGDSQYASRDSHEAEEQQESDEGNGNLEARVQKHSKENKSVLEKKANKNSEKGKSYNREIPDGEVAIIYHEYPDGRIKALFEEKPKGVREAGKLSFIGGGKEPYVDIGPKSTAKREIREEVANEDAVRVLLNALDEDGEEYFVYKGYGASGKQFKVPIRLIKVKSDKDWEKVEKSPLTAPTSTDITGYARVLPLEKILSKGNDEYAFDYGKVIRKFFRERHPTQYRLALSGAYSMPIVSTSHSHVQTIDAFVNNSLAQSYSFPTINTSYKPLQNMGASQFSLN